MFFRKRTLLLAALLALFFTAAPDARAQGEQPPPQQTPTPAPTPTPRDAPPADEDVERIESDLTNVLVNVTDRQRRFVTTLVREDVRVLEDGVPQEVFTFQRETELPLSLAVLVDTSASQEGVLKDEQEAATAFVNSVLRPGRDAAAVVSFTGITRIEQPLTRDRAALAAAIGAVRVEHNINDPECGDDDTIPQERKLRCLTGVWDSIFLTVQEVLAQTPPSTRRAVVILTDGDDTSSKKRIYQAVEFAVQHNAVVYAIGIRDRDFEYGELKKDHLRKVSEETGGRAFFPKNRRELDAAFAQIDQELRTQYLLAYSPSNKKRDGSLRRVTVEITNPKLRKDKLRLHYRQGYYARADNQTAAPPPLPTADTHNVADPPKKP